MAEGLWLSGTQRRTFHQPRLRRESYGELIQAHGCPLAFYSDKHTVFRVNKPDAKGGQGVTQFGRALAELNIEILCANSSQAKGCVERANYSIRSERQLVEQLDYNLLFRWFIGLDMDDAVWNHAVFSKNRDRLLTSEVAQRFFGEVNRLAKRFMRDDTSPSMAR